MLPRRPEPEIVMESHDSVTAFDSAGAEGGPLVPIYHFNATAVSRLIPRNGRVLDLACGPGNFLAHLLEGRPDLRAVGLDLSGEMLAVARQNFERRGLSERVELVQGDWSRADDAVQALSDAAVDAVTCLSALHHCPTRADLTAVLSAIARLRQTSGSAVWLFDLVRPESEDLLELIPRAFEVASRSALPVAFKRDWSTSLHAGWTMEEFSLSLNEAGLRANSVEADYSQLHTLPPVRASDERIEWAGPAPSESAVERAQKMDRTFGQNC